MDKAKAVQSWDWLPDAMPGVARLFAERRAKDGKAHTDECWRRGVKRLEPGWFFAREGAVALGTPWDHPDLVNFAAAQVTSTQALLVLRDPEATNGAG